MTPEPGARLRVSSYLIGAPLPEQPFHLLMHGFTGSVDKVPAVLGEHLVQRRGESFGGDDAPDISEMTVERLVERGYLTQLRHEEEREILLRIAATLHEADLASHTTAFVLVPTYMCNLRCPYCFQEHGMHAGKGEFSRLMTRERADHAFGVIDRFRRPGAVAEALGVLEPEAQGAACEAHGSGDCEITLFGGEPLLEDTVPIVSYVVAEAAARGIMATAITNGVELGRFQHLLGPGLLEELQITLDGPPHIHDQRRIGPGHRRTFEAIAANVDMALARGVRVGLRINVNAANAEHLEELDEIVTQRGWRDHPNFFANAAAVHGAHLAKANRNLLPSPKLVEITIRLRKERGSRIDSYESVARRTLSNCIRGTGYPFHSAAFCAAEAGMLILDPLGHVYACWEEIGQKAHRIGDYGGDGISFRREVLGQWLARFPGAIEACSNCPYALIHKSGCAYQARRATKTMFSAACASFQEYFPMSLADAYSEEESKALVEVA
jgi:uncharacterized protein